MVGFPRTGQQIISAPKRARFRSAELSFLPTDVTHFSHCANGGHPGRSPEPSDPSDIPNRASLARSSIVSDENTLLKLDLF